jgi:hypothetical protein
MGKEKLHFLGVIVFALTTALLANSFPAQAGSNCASKLVGKSYTCEFNEEGGVLETNSTTDFVTGGLSTDFDMVFEPSGDYGCVCETKGPVDSPSYDSSSSTFICESNFGFMAVGKVSGKKVTGQGTNATQNGGPFIFTCKEK